MAMKGSPSDLIDFMDRADVRMVQRGRGFGLSLESAESLCVVGEFVGQELQGDVATELEVFGLIHHTHAPATNPAEDAVMGNRLPHGSIRALRPAKVHENRSELKENRTRFGAARSTQQ